MKCQRGFTLIEILLVIIALSMVGGVGYYVYSSQQDKEIATSDVSNQQTAKEANSEIAPDPTTGWKSYNSANFSLKHPSEWLEMKNSENCPDYFGRGASEGSQGICQSDAASQISVVASSESPASYAPMAEYYSDIAKTTVQVDGISSDRYATVSKGTEFMGFEDKGAKSVQYIFTKSGKTIVATYSDGNGRFKDVLADFDIMMTKTFKFK